MNDKLKAFLRDRAAREFHHGDCGFLLADWYMALTGRPDPVAHLRDHHDGDLPRHVRETASALGLEEPTENLDGDIGLVRIGNRLKGAIFIGTRWWTPCERGGLDTLPRVAAIKSWRIVA